MFLHMIQYLFCCVLHVCECVVPQARCTVWNARQAWYNFTDPHAPWRYQRPHTPPFKSRLSPLCKIPGALSPHRLYPDVAHTFHMGFGKDMAASTIVWLARRGFFGREVRFDDRISNAYAQYMAWCHANKKHTATEAFSCKNFSMSSSLCCMSSCQTCQRTQIW